MQQRLREPTVFGREEETQTGLAALAEQRHVSIVGVDGSGKSATTRAIAFSGVSADLFQHIIVIDPQKPQSHAGLASSLAEQTTLERILAQLAHDLGIRYASVVRDLGTRVEMLRYAPVTGSVLLVIDHAEIISDDEAPLLHCALEHMPPRCHAVVLSRRHLPMPLHEIKLAPLTWDDVVAWIQTAAIRNPALYPFFAYGEVQWRQLYQITEGFPLAIQCILKGLAQNPILLEPRYAQALGKLKGEVGRQVFKGIPLLDTERQVLQAVALSPKATRFGLLKHITNLDCHTLETALAHLQSWCLINLEGQTLYAPSAGTRFARSLGGRDHDQETRFAEYWAGFVLAPDVEPALVMEEWLNIRAALEILWRSANIVDRTLLGSAVSAEWFTAMVTQSVRLLVPGDQFPQDDRLVLFHRTFQAAFALRHYKVAGWLAAFVANDMRQAGLESDASEWLDEAIATFNLLEDGEEQIKLLIE